MIDYDKEQLITLAEAAASLPVTTHPQTVQCWTSRGVRGVVLESYCIGTRRFTSKEALERFLAKLNEPDKSPPQT